MTAKHMHVAKTERRQAKHLHFTLTALRALRPPATGRAWVYDEVTPGLAMMITAAGTKTYYLYKKLDGLPERIRLAAFDELSIEQVRKLVQQKIGNYFNGKNPAVAKRDARAADSFGELFRLFIEKHAKLKKKTWREDEQRYELYLKCWANRKPASITVDEVRALHAKIGKKRPGQANRVMALASKLFNYGGIESNPCRGLEKFNEIERERFLQPYEMPPFFEALAQEDQVWQDFFVLALMTGARSGNLQRMKWQEIDLRGNLWTIPAAEFKNKQKQEVPLVPAAVEILQRRAGEADGSGWVFPGKSVDGHITRPEKAWARVCQNAKLEDLWIHDLRRSSGSWQSEAGSPLNVISKALGHRTIQTTMIYARTGIDPVRKSMGAAADAMLAAASGKPATPAPAAPPAPTIDILGELERLAALKAAGVITDEDMAVLKARLMGNK